MGSLLPTVCALAWQLTHTIRRLSSSKALGLLLLHRCSHNFVGTNQGKSQQDLQTFLRLLLPRWLSFCPMESQVVPGREAWRWSLVLGTASVKDGQEREAGASHEEHGERPGDAQYLQHNRAT